MGNYVGEERDSSTWRAFSKISNMSQNFPGKKKVQFRQLSVMSRQIRSWLLCSGARSFEVLDLKSRFGWVPEVCVHFFFHSCFFLFRLLGEFLPLVVITREREGWWW